MDDSDLTKIMDGMEAKLGKEEYATISDELGNLITLNSQAKEATEKLKGQVSDLEKIKDKLVRANTNLLAQIPAIDDKKPNQDVSDVEEESKFKDYDFFQDYDKNGNFKRKE